MLYEEGSFQCVGTMSLTRLSMEELEGDTEKIYIELKRLREHDILKSSTIITNMTEKYRKVFNLWISSKKSSDLLPMDAKTMRIIEAQNLNEFISTNLKPAW